MTHSFRGWLRRLATAGLAVAALTSGVDTAAAQCKISGCKKCEKKKCDKDDDDTFLSCKELKNRVIFEDSCGDHYLKYSIGGALRYRYYNEDNRLRPPGAGGSFQSNYSQWRFTPFLEADYSGIVKARVEAIDAPTFGNDIGQLPIDENRYDLLQYYVDLKLYEDDDRSANLKVGRQLILFGDQHAVSPLAWANTFRNFEGGRLTLKGKKWDVDGILVRSVNAAAGNVFRPQNFDTPDQSRWLAGVYSTYKGLDKGDKLDLYWFWSNEEEPGLGRTDGNRQTFGARIYGTRPVKDCCDEVVRTWKYDLQGARQFGSDSVTGINGGAQTEVSAGFINAQLSHTWNKAEWTPTLTGLFYYGSGDNDPNDDDYGTVYTLYPLGHAYWGLADQFSGQNLLDFSPQITVKPTKKLTCLAAFHAFYKAESDDAVYNIANVRLGPTAGTGSRIGNELDLVATYKWKKNVTLQGGYFWFWYGEAIDDAGAFARDDSQTWYGLINWTF